jgi:DNA (cytosine-5)-methyltransferase 1
MKNSYITATDQFCGAGGSSQGARKAGVEVKMALNHWKLAIETHNTNFPDTLHDCTDISACDPRRYPSTNILITSPECTTHSPAGGNRHNKVKQSVDLFDNGLIDPSSERSRATMWDVCRFAEYHDYEIIIVENVVEAKTRWVLFEVWLNAMHKLGYNHKCLYLNSMHFWPTPQSRDRMYVVFWKKGNKAPDLDYTPKAFCTCCGKDVMSVQNWKNPSRKFGKYRTQYVYVCPSDGTIVTPYYYAAFNAIDWSDIGQKIGERKKSLSPNTMNRIQWGLDKYGDDPLIIQTRQVSGLGSRVKNSTTNPIGTQCTELSHEVATPIIVKGEHTSLPGYVKKIGDPFMTQTVRQTSSLVMPWIIEMNKTGEAKPSAETMSTITAGGINHALLTSPLIVQNKGQSKSKPATQSMPAQTTMINNGIVSHQAWSSFIQYYYKSNQSSKLSEPIGTVTTNDRSYIVNYQKPRIEDCYYRMIKAPEVKASMAFDTDYIILGNSKEQVKQCGNAVTPPVQEWIIKQCVKSLEE